MSTNPAVTFADENEVNEDLATAIEVAARSHEMTVLDYDVEDLWDGARSRYIRIIVKPITEAEFNSELGKTL